MTRSRTEEGLASVRAARGFDAAEVLAAKVGRLSVWFAGQGLDAAVVGVSGGVDSAVVLGLLRRAVPRVVALSVPIAAAGATGQAVAARRAALVAEAFGVELWEAPFAQAHGAAMASLETGSGLEFDGWSAGQMLSVMRTPALYGAVALLRAAGHQAVVCGTTNRDEGAYLGFFGKASDGMVDVQPISDLHKSEVRALGELLGAPDEVLAAEPSGDVWDGRDDAAMMGAGYDEVELYLRMRELGRPFAHPALDALHAINAHKYAVGSPAVHLDVLPRGVPGGWEDTPLSGRDDRRPPPGVLPGEWTPPPIELGRIQGTGPLILSGRDCERLVGAMRETSVPEPVDVTGVRSDGEIGSHRATAWAPELAAALYERLRPLVPSVRFIGPYDFTEGHVRTWRAVGLSPVLRFMSYARGGRHLCHYDAGFDYGDGRRTLMSVVFFLTGDGDPSLGGALRFIEDGQAGLPVWERDHRDWDRDARQDEIVRCVWPVAGTAVVFDHRTPHDVERWLGDEPRVIIRADVVYEAVPDGRTLP